MPFTLDQSRWKSAPNGKGAGFCCSECNTWKHASEFLTCKCDVDKQYVIAGADHGEPTWWNNEEGWVHDFDEATTFSKGIFGESLPPGSTGILEMTLTGDCVEFHPITPPREGVVKSQKKKLTFR